MAQADPPAPFFEEHVLTNGGFKTSDIPIDLTSDYINLPSGALAHAGTDILLQPVPILTTDAETTKASASGYSNLEYYVTISGPQNIKVPIIVSVNGLKNRR